MFLVHESCVVNPSVTVEAATTKSPPKDEMAGRQFMRLAAMAFPAVTPPSIRRHPVDVGCDLTHHSER